ncbi:hypothetical protein [Salinicoccus halitifaciens]|uniref:5-bromo-4-chloroindolyl phosphate hydrolysis protein n=1 Tax=Salinicoccus halitifaciens TaxID=1073415 RepID=A0ABV2EC90_9STAP|nr:hypothetical protein [Salinicoccus halitifaciens]MCD2138797.1 hypothetical protein [Salinicoccus halitifaciens]
MNSEDKYNLFKGMTIPSIIFTGTAIGVFIIFIFVDLPNARLAFLGSYSGGILGTLGVIYVAHIQGQQQLKHLKTVENNEKARLKTEIQLNKIYTYHDLLQTLDADLTNLKDTANTLILLLSGPEFKALDSKKTSDRFLTVLRQTSQYKESHFYEMTAKAEMLNKTLRNDNELKLEDLSPLNSYEKIDHSLKVINQSTKLIENGLNVHQIAPIVSSLSDSIDENFFNEINEIEKWIFNENINIDSNLTKLMERLN